jgi:hypothetical protein
VLTDVLYSSLGVTKTVSHFFHANFMIPAHHSVSAITSIPDGSALSPIREQAYVLNYQHPHVRDEMS